MILINTNSSACMYKRLSNSNTKMTPAALHTHTCNNKYNLVRVFKEGVLQAHCAQNKISVSK